MGRALPFLPPHTPRSASPPACRILGEAPRRGAGSGPRAGAARAGARSQEGGKGAERGGGARGMARGGAGKSARRAGRAARGGGAAIASAAATAAGRGGRAGPGRPAPPGPCPPSTRSLGQGPGGRGPQGVGAACAGRRAVGQRGVLALGLAPLWVKELLRAQGREGEGCEALIVQRNPGSVDSLSGKLLLEMLVAALGGSVARSLAASREPAFAVTQVQLLDEVVGQGLCCQPGVYSPASFAGQASETRCQICPGRACSLHQVLDPLVF